MTKKSVTLSAVEAEASTQFSFILRILKFGAGRFGPLKIHSARSHLDTKRVKIETSIASKPIVGELALKVFNGQWRLYCAASDVRFEDWHASFSFDYEKQVYSITKYFVNGNYETMTVNMVTGERKVFADPADAPFYH